MIRVVLPVHLRTLARVGGEVQRDRVGRGRGQALGEHRLLGGPGVGRHQHSDRDRQAGEQQQDE